MAAAVAVTGALNNAASAVDKLVSLSRSYTDTQRKLSMYPGQLAAFERRACAVKQVLDDTPPRPEGSALHIARGILSFVVDKGLARQFCTLCTVMSFTQAGTIANRTSVFQQDLPDASETKSWLRRRAADLAACFTGSSQEQFLLAIASTELDSLKSVPKLLTNLRTALIELATPGPTSVTPCNEAAAAPQVGAPGWLWPLGAYPDKQKYSTHGRMECRYCH